MFREDLFQKIDLLNDKYVKVWEDVCNIESPTNNKEGVDAVADYFIEMAERNHWLVEVLENEKAGKAVCITINPEVAEAPVVFSGHIDTVHPVGFFGTPAVRKDEKYIYGPGVTDCKGGVVSSFLALDALAQVGFKGRPVKLIIQSDEEVGSSLSDKKTIEFMCEKSKDAVAFLNTEGTKLGKVVIARKGIIRFEFKLCGKAEHSSRCYNGINAITEAAHIILELEKFKDPDGITCNCGLVKGGTAANSVASECILTADFRYATEEQYNDIAKKVEYMSQNPKLEGIVITTKILNDRPAMALTDRNTKLLEKMNEIFVENDMPVLVGSFQNGGSDAAYTTKSGIPTIDNLGVKGDFIHSINECAELESLSMSAKRLALVASSI